MQKESWINKKVKYNFRYHLRSYKAAILGVIIALKCELNFIIELSFAVLVLIAAIIFGVTKVEWMILTICIFITLSSELMNTSIESLIELKQFNPVVKKVKDLAAGAVFIVAVMDVIIGVLIFGPYLLELIRN